MKYIFVALCCILLPFYTFAQSHMPVESLRPVADKIKEYKQGGLSDKPIVYSIPSMQQVRIATINYDDDVEVDIYYPPNYDFSKPLPMVLLVHGNIDKAYESGSLAKHTGGNAFRNLLQMISWAQAIAASGMIAITYETVARPDLDVIKVIAYLNQNQQYLGIDINNIGLWASSDDGYLAQEMLVNSKYDFKDRIRCLVLYYAGDSEMSPMPKKDFPVLLVRPGKDNIPGNQKIYRNFITAAQEAGIALTLIDYPDGVHGFDRINDTDRSREIIAETLDYLRIHLLLE
jgi:dienelactone hydrolase